jgi:hypothetical protein
MRLFILLMLAGVLTCHAQHDIYFLPCATNATVSFEGETQGGGREIHRLEVRRIGYVSRVTNEKKVANSSCVVYYAGDEYGPYILCTLDDCVAPLVRKVSKDIVEVYYTAGAHTHFRQSWKLLGWTAKLEKREEIEWSEDPRTKADAEQGAPANRR